MSTVGSPSSMPLQSSAISPTTSSSSSIGVGGVALASSPAPASSGTAGGDVTPTLGGHIGGINGGSSSTGGTPCCETGRPVVTDPVTGQSVCSCQYERLQASLQQAAVAAAAAARMHGVHPGVYGAAYPSSEQNPYPSLGMDTSAAFYSSLVSHFISILLTFNS